jgi:hypothetical protein
MEYPRWTGLPSILFKAHMSIFHKRIYEQKINSDFEASNETNQKSKFLTRLGRIGEKCPDTATWLEHIGRDPNDVDRNNRSRYDLRALSFDEGGHGLGMMTTNGPESLNNIFKEARELPVTSLVEIIFYKIVKYFAERRTNAEIAVQQRFLFSLKIQALLEERRLSENTHTMRAYQNE